MLPLEKPAHHLDTNILWGSRYCLLQPCCEVGLGGSGIVNAAAFPVLVDAPTSDALPTPFPKEKIHLGFRHRFGQEASDALLLRCLVNLVVQV